MNVREVVMIGRYGLLGLFRRPSRRDWKIVDEVLELVGMTHLARRPIGHLSGGEQQRTAIARALVFEPGLLLADEPTGNLDTVSGEHISQLLFDMNRESGTTLVLVTHDKTLAARFDRIMELEAGRLKG